MEKCEFEYLGPYKVEGVLGRGGMGAVYKGVHSKSGQAVAIKVIAPGVADQMRFRRRFNAEIETLTRLRHPNIVQIIGVGEEQGLLFYSMEYVEGHSLHEHLRQHRKLDWMEVVQVGIQVSAALKHAHDLGVIHRDLKPANLMLTRQSIVKLTDFGIAKLFGSTEMTAVGSVIGTADFMPPEQAEGRGVTVRSDLYSLGSVMYALLSGRAPFAGKSVPEVLYAVRYTPAPDSTGFASDAPAELHALISELLEKDPQRRPPTALVVGNRLKALQAGVAKLEQARARTASGHDPISDQAVAKELTSIDLEDEKVDLPPAGRPTNQDLPTAVASESVLEKLARQGGVTRPRSGASNVSIELANTIDSRAEPLPSADQPLPSSISHYTPVSEAEARKFTLGSDPHKETEGVEWMQLVSIGAMVLLLFGLLAGAYFYAQPYSADQLYMQIAAAVESGDESELSSEFDSMQEFVERFPQDARIQEIQQWMDEVEFMRTVRNLRRKARNGSGDLSAIEQAFLTSADAMGRDPQEGQRKFGAFQSVYGTAPDLSRKEKRLLELAAYASRSLARGPARPDATATAELERLISTAEKHLPKTKLPEFYKSIVELYGDKPWAKDAINRINGLNN